jgi:hypothetical protein
MNKEVTWRERREGWRSQEKEAGMVKSSHKAAPSIPLNQDAQSLLPCDHLGTICNHSILNFPDFRTLSQTNSFAYKWLSLWYSVIATDNGARHNLPLFYIEPHPPPTQLMAPFCAVVHGFIIHIWLISLVQWSCTEPTCKLLSETKLSILGSPKYILPTIYLRYLFSASQVLIANLFSISRKGLAQDQPQIWSPCHR